jgi:hypothetical protein
VDVDKELPRALDVHPPDSAFSLIDNGESLEADLMEDLERELTDLTSEPALGEAVNPSASIRAAAADDPAIAALIELEEPIRGADLQPSLRGRRDWVTLADLDVRPHPEPTGFVPFIPGDALPSGDQRLVVGVGSARTYDGFRIKAGTALNLIGMSLREARQVGRTELMFEAGGMLLTVRLVGDWPIDHQLGGMLVVPRSDPLVGEDTQFRGQLSQVVGALMERDRSKAKPSSP